MLVSGKLRYRGSQLDSVLAAAAIFLGSSVDCCISTGDKKSAITGQLPLVTGHTG